MGLENRPTFYFDKSADQSGEGSLSAAGQARAYIHELTVAYPDLPAQLAESPHAPSIRAQLETTREAQAELDQVVNKLAYVQQKLDTLTIRLAATTALARGDIPFLTSLIEYPEAKQALALSSNTAPTIENLTQEAAIVVPEAQTVQEEPKQPQEASPQSVPTSPEEELGIALTSLPTPTFVTKPIGRVLAEEPQEPKMSWADLLGEHYEPADQQLATKIIKSLIGEVQELQEFEGDVLGAIQKLADIEEDALHLALLSLFPTKKSVPSIARFLAIYHRIKTGEILSREVFYSHAETIQDQSAATLLPQAAAKTPTPAEDEKPVAGLKPADKEKKEKEHVIAELLGAFRIFYDGARVKNFSVEWPMANGRLVIPTGRLTTTFVDRAIDDQIVKPVRSENRKHFLTERDAVSLLLYRLNEKHMRNHGPRGVRKLLEKKMEHYWEARRRYEKEYQAQRKTKLPHPGLEQ